MGFARKQFDRKRKKGNFNRPKTSGYSKKNSRNTDREIARGNFEQINEA